MELLLQLGCVVEVDLSAERDDVVGAVVEPLAREADAQGRSVEPSTVMPGTYPAAVRR